VLGGEHERSTEVTGSDGREDLSALADKSGHVGTVAARADVGLTSARQGGASAEAHGAPNLTTTQRETAMSATATIDLETSLDRTVPAVARPITQYSRRTIFAIWAAASIPMGILAWIVAPAIADGDTAVDLFEPLVACLTVGLVWQFVLALALVGREQGTLRWSVLRDAMWLRSPRSPKTGKVGGKIWWIVVPITIGLAAEEVVSLPPPLSRNIGELLSSDAGQALFHGSWGLFALCVTMFLFNTVFGEELLFRGVLLPRMEGAFGKRDWVANGLLHATYHWHVPWVIPASVVDMFLVAYPARRYRSALLSMAVHSAQTVMFTLILLTLVV
jgi:membrane protease YdiL (CAAX protease family)